MKRIAPYAIIAAVVAGGFAAYAFAAIPQQINYQSRLRSSSGAAVTTATRVSFSLYSAASGGSALWTETRDQASGSCAKVTPDADGYFSVQLGSCASFPSSLAFDAALFLGVTVGSDAEATPRVPFSPSPYALNASRVGTFAGDPANSKVMAETTGTATAGTTGFNSSALTFRGSGWNGSSAQTRDVTIRNIVTSGSSSRLGIFNNAGTEIVSILDSGAIGVGVTNPIGAMEVVGDFYADRLLVRGGTVFNSFNASTNSDQTSFTRPKYFIGSATSTSDSNPKNLVQYEITGTTFLEDVAFSKLVSVANRQIKFGSNTLTFPAGMPASDGQVLSGTTAGALSWVDGSSGTVTSVGLALPNIFSVANSPITSSGTSTATLVTQTENTFFAAPNGSNGTPSFRAIVAADIPTLSTSSIPNLDASKITSGTLAVARGGTGLGLFTANSLIYASGATVLGQIPIGSNGEVLTISGGVPTWASLPGSGTVTSVGLVMNGGLFTVSGSPITGSGTSTASLIAQNPNKVLAGPQSGVVDAAPTFRDLVAADIPLLSSSSIPSIDASKVTSGVFGIGRIPDLNADKIVSGIFDIARIPDIPAAKITGTLSTSSIPNLDANKITSGTLAVARGGTNLSSYTANGVLYAPTSGTIGQIAAGSNGQVLTLSGGAPIWAPGASGTVTSAGLVLPSVFTVSNSPITSSGTTTATLATQVTKTFFAGPASGADAAPTFRAILAADVPTLNQNTTGTASNITGILGAASFPALTGDVTTSAGSLVTTIGAGKVTNAMLAGSIDASKISSGTFSLARLPAGTNGQVLTTQLGAPVWANAAAGTVTSVGVSVPAFLSVTGSPITSSGTVAISIPNQNPNAIFAGPGSGASTAQPTFRALVEADIPSLNASKINAGTLAVAQGGTNLSSYTANGLLYAPTASTIGQVTTGANGNFLTLSGGVPAWSTLPASGTVTSVGLTSTSSVITVAGSPITSNGTTSIGLATQNANIVLAGPVSGGATNPTFRALVAADIPLLASSSIPNLDANKITSGTLAVARGGTNLSSYTANGVLYAPTSGTIGQIAAGSNGQVLTLSGGAPIWAAGASGTVTSAGLALPGIFSVSNSPITSSGTTTATLATQVTKTFFAGPASGADAAPTFRAILAADVPTLNQNTTGTASNITGILGAASFPALTGDVTTSAGSLVTTIGAGKVTNAMLAGSIDASKISSGTFSLARLPAGTNGQVLTTQLGAPVWANAAAGTVTSVGVSVPAFLSVTGSPITSSGTVAISIPNQNPNAIFAGPGSGASTAQPTFRALVEADIPSLNASKIGVGTLAVARGGTNLSSYTANGLLYAPTASTIGQISIGSSGQVLTIAGGVPTWAAPPSSGVNLYGTSNLSVLSGMPSGVSGSFNTAVAGASLNGVTSGSNNTAIGNTSLFKVTTGSSNTAVGTNTLYQNISGSGNVAIGTSAGTNVLGSNNTVVGTSADANGNFTNAMALGSGAQATKSNQVVIGNGSITETILRGTITDSLRITSGTLGAGRVLTSDALGNAAWTAPAAAGWGLTGNAGTVNGTNFIGTTDNVPLSFKVNGGEVARFTVDSAVILGGGTVTNGGVVIGGQVNAVTNRNVAVGGFQNSTVSGALLSVLAGGQSNSISANGLGSFIGGGTSNILGGVSNAIVGGSGNSIISAGGANPADKSVIAGGQNNIMRASASFIGGGSGNTINNFNNGIGAIIGGASNTITGEWSAIMSSDNLTVGSSSFGFSPRMLSVPATNISSMSNVAYFGNADVLIGNTSGSARSLRFYEPNSSGTYSGTNFTAFRAQPQGADIAYTLPAAAPTANGQSLVATTAGIMSWATTAGIGGSGASSTLPVFITGGTTIGSSIVSQLDARTIGIGGTIYVGTGPGPASGNAIVSSGMPNNTTGFWNAALGIAALSQNTTGQMNVALGTSSLGKNTGGRSNVSAGYASMYNNTGGNYNTALGDTSMYDNTTGAYNVAIGSGSLRTNTTGANNVGVGQNALTYNVTGSYNTAVGDGAGVSSGTPGLTNTTALGFGAETTKSNQVVIGNTSVTETLLRGVITDTLKVTGGTPGIGKVLTSDASGNATWAPGVSTSTLFANGGNSFGGPAVLSINDTYPLTISAGEIRLRGNVSMGTSATSVHEVNGTLRIFNDAGAGKVLTSDASGNATWQAITAGGGAAASGWTSSAGTVALATTTDKVGIGTASPATALHVVGDTTVAGNIMPSTTGMYDLGSATNHFRNIFVDNLQTGNSIKFGSDSIWFKDDPSTIVYTNNLSVVATTTGATMLTFDNATIGIPSGKLKFGSAAYTFPTSLGTAGQVLTVTSTPGVLVWASPSSAGDISGAGTANTVPLWTGTKLLGNSPITVSGATTTIGTSQFTNSSALIGGSLAVSGSLTVSGQTTLNGGPIVMAAPPSMPGLKITNGAAINSLLRVSDAQGTVAQTPSPTATGQVLTYDGTNMTWQLPSGASCEAPVFTGDKTITGDLSVGGISSNLIPSVARTYDLGSAAKPWRDIYVSSSTLKFVDDSGQVDATLSLTKGGDIVLENKETKTRKVLGEGGGGLTGFASKVEDGQLTLSATAKDAVFGTKENAIDVFADKLSAKSLQISVPGADAKGKALVVESVDAEGKVGIVGFASLADERVEPLVSEVSMLKSQLASLQTQFAILVAAVAAKQDEVSSACVTGTVPLRTTNLKGSGDWKITGTVAPAPAPKQVSSVPVVMTVPTAVPVTVASVPAPVVAGPVLMTQTKTATRLINVYGNPPSSDMQWNNVGNGQSQASNSASVTARKGQILSADGFGFSIPPSAKIESISVTVSRRSEKGTTADDTVYVLKGGALVGIDLATADGLWPLSASAMSSATFALPAGAFGLTPGDVNGAFSVGIRPTLGGTDQAVVGSVSVTVKYLAP